MLGKRKYIPIEWPEIQGYMGRVDWKEHFYDPTKDTWLIPEFWEEEMEDDFSGREIGDLENAIG